MKKDIKKLVKLFIFLVLISTIVILIFGRTYTVGFNYRGSNYDLKVNNDTGKVLVLDKHIKDNEYLVKVKAKKAGKVYIRLTADDYGEEKVLYVHKSMVITDNTYFGKATASEVIPISLSIILIYAIYILIKKYRYCIKDNLYQYKNIAYLGIIIFLSIFTLNNIFAIFNYHGVYDTVNAVIGSMSLVSFFLFPIAFITFLLVTITNIKLIRKEGLSLRNLLGLLLGIFICVATLLPNILYNILMKTQKVDIYNLNSIGPYLYNFIEVLIYLSVAYLECVLIGTIIIALKSVKKYPKYDKDYMIILGCKINKDGTLPPLLKGRVDKAIEFRNKQLDIVKKDLIFIPSGGKGRDEVISEAEAMKNYLLEQGIDKDNILIEDKSKNTYENIKFSNELIKSKDAKVCYSTTNYHVLRAGLIATEQGLKLDGIGSSTKVYFWINAFIREFIGTLYSEKKKHIIILILIIITLIIMIGITYIANNT